MKQKTVKDRIEEENRAHEARAKAVLDDATKLLVERGFTVEYRVEKASAMRRGEVTTRLEVAPWRASASWARGYQGIKVSIRPNSPEKTSTVCYRGELRPDLQVLANRFEKIHKAREEANDIEKRNRKRRQRLESELALEFPQVERPVGLILRKLDEDCYEVRYQTQVKKRDVDELLKAIRTSE
jgi:hypothetical protein